MNHLQVEILSWVGVVCIILGVGLMVWSTVQKRTAAGAGLKGASEFLKQIAALFDAIGRLFPTAAGRVGMVLVLLGLFLTVGLPLLASPSVAG